MKKDIKDNSALFKNKQIEEEKETAKNDVLAQRKIDAREGLLVYLDSEDKVKIDYQPLKGQRKITWEESLVLLGQAANFIRMQICLNVMGEHIEKRLAQVLGNHSELPKVDGTAGETKEPH